MDGEVDDAADVLECFIEVFAGIVGCSDGCFGICLGGFGYGLAHTAGFSCDENGKHVGRMMDAVSGNGNGNF